jgi:phytoene synthase
MPLTGEVSRPPSDYFDDAHGTDWSIAVNSSTFKPTLRLFPSSIREDTDRLYHVLRVLDDLVDERRPEAPERISAVEAWCRDGAVTSPESEVFAHLADRYGMSPQGVEEFCKGMRHDLARAPIDTEADLDLYCQRVGGGVGVMLAQLLGVTRRVGEQKMATLGTAFQLTNILRDIDEDLAHDRRYIPRELIQRHGPLAPGSREALLREQIARADELYDEGIKAIPLLQQGRRAMMVAAALYREILRQIEREGYGQRPGRVIVPAWRRRILLTKSRYPPPQAG